MMEAINKLRFVSTSVYIYADSIKEIPVWVTKLHKVERIKTRILTRDLQPHDTRNSLRVDWTTLKIQENMEAIDQSNTASLKTWSFLY